VGDLAQGVGLIHKLRELRTAEEFAYRGHHRLGIYQVVRHGRGHFLVNRHLFLDGAFHANEADAELVFQEFADGAHPAIAEMIDVVDRADILAQLEQVTDGGDKVAGVQRASFERRLQAKFDIELQPADLAEVIFARIKEHAVEKRRSGFQGGRIAGTQLAIDLDQGLARRADGVFIERPGDDHAGIVSVREEDIHAGNTRLGQSGPDILG
jgi:hypothetical protein